MNSSRVFVAIVLVVLFAVQGPLPAQEQTPSAVRFPYPEKLIYSIEWRLVTAGNATVDMSRAASNGWQTSLDLQSVGWVNRFYRILDSYKVSSTQNFCGLNSVLDAQEGKRHAISSLTFDANRHRVRYDDRDLVKNQTTNKELAVSPCTHEIIGALQTLRASGLQPGKSMLLPITDGKKLATARIEGQAKESISISGKTYATVRYEAFLFDNVLYKRKGRLFIWITDDEDRVPVQLRLQMGFPVGNVTIHLDKQQKT